MKKLFALFAFAAFAALASGYSDISLFVTAQVKEDGMAHVTERVLVALNSKDEMEAFDSNMQRGATTISDWTIYSPGGNVRYHLSGRTIPFNVRITAKRDFTIGNSVGVIIIEYDLNQSMFSVEQIGSRKIRYKLNKAFLSFQPSKSGETVLPVGTKLAFELPKDATIVAANPEPSEKTTDSVAWFGRVSGNWELIFEREKPLGAEVSEFFYDLYANTAPLAVGVAVVAILALVALKLVVRPK